MRSALLIILPFLLFSLATKPLLGEAAEEPEAVRDLNGDKLRAGIDYYILPVVRGRGGGLTMGSRGKQTCPLDVVQDRYEVSKGLPLTFTPVNPKKGVIRVSTDLNIKFSAASTCVQSTVWKLDNYDEWRKQWFVTTSGVQGNPGPKTLDNYDEWRKQWFVTTSGVQGNPGPKTVSNWFKIEKNGDDYNLRFCPTVCNYCKVQCRDIGIYIDEAGVRRLALSDVPFKVMFKKA
ncbi:hypothetical protein Tsubulata_035421 [Turnera subulata]|uniref:Miraculin-like n=1 Tax=Turnera subulata TaxID=218843 RepID=A0A9Q0J5Z6_9ROSI|nr:hypothetical protein Tsubulata_035421 [Turnera subulata]